MTAPVGSLIEPIPAIRHRGRSDGPYTVLYSDEYCIVYKVSKTRRGVIHYPAFGNWKFVSFPPPEKPTMWRMEEWSYQRCHDQEDLVRPGWEVMLHEYISMDNSVIVIVHYRRLVWD